MFNFNGKYKFLDTALIVTLMVYSSSLFAADAQTIADVAKNIIAGYENLTKMITAATYLAGIGFMIGAVMKFRQHKDNPTQIPVGTPIALVIISAALLYFPSLLQITGNTLFGQGDYTSAGWQGTAQFLPTF